MAAGSDHCAPPFHHTVRLWCSRRPTHRSTRDASRGGEHVMSRHVEVALKFSFFTVSINLLVLEKSHGCDSRG